MKISQDTAHFPLFCVCWLQSSVAGLYLAFGDVVGWLMHGWGRYPERLLLQKHNFPVLLCLICINKVFHIPPAFLLCWLQACLYLHDRPTIASLTLHSDVIQLLFTSLVPVWHYPSHHSQVLMIVTLPNLKQVCSLHLKLQTQQLRRLP